MTNLLRTPLFEEHVKLGAKMLPFAGFEMPIQYSSVKDEVIAVRENAGIFDVGHMGEFWVTGKEAVDFVDYILVNDFKESPVSKAVYSPLCREDGTIIDDLIAYKISEDRVLICVNAANIKKDWDWINQFSGKFECSLEDKSSSTSLVALQGPKSSDILKDIGLLSDDSAEYYSAFSTLFQDSEVIVARTGYTGEDGFEIFGTDNVIKSIWSESLKHGALPCGLASRDVLRIEVCYPLYGHEIDDTKTPLDAALKWTVKFNDRDFVGKEALINYTPKSRLVKLSIDKGIPREGYEILNEREEVIGKVTSGTMSTIFGKGIALGEVDRKLFPENKKFKIKIRKNIVEANYHAKAFIKGGHK